MARLKLIRFSLTALKGFNKKKALVFINWIIFASIFALTASIVSMIYENKIDEIDNKIINEETNILIYENQIKTTPLVLKNLEDVFFDNYKIGDYLKLLAIRNNKDTSIATSRDTIFKPYWEYEAAASYGLEQIKQSMSDAILVSNNLKDILEIEKSNIDFHKIEKELRDIINKRKKISNEWQIQEQKNFSSKVDPEEAAGDKENYYKKYLPLNNKLIQVIQDQIIFFTNFNIKYFSRKKTETEETILKMESKLKYYSNQESIIILSAFFLQLLVFLSVQYFEITMETANAKRTAKK